MEKDVTQKVLLDYNDIFADIVNVLLFKGEEKVKPNELVSAQTVSMYKIDDKVHEQERDVVKFWKTGNAYISVFGIENQSAIDPMMPLRIIGYDGANYRAQLAKGKQGQRRRGYPVISLVLHYGDREWKDKKTLKECLHIPDGLDEYVNDYKINVFDIAFLSEEQRNLFKSDFKAVADFFCTYRIHGAEEGYTPKDLPVKEHVDEVLKLLSTFSKISPESFTVTEGGIDVVSAFTETWKQIERKIDRKVTSRERQRFLDLMIENGSSDSVLLNECKFSKKEIDEARKRIAVQTSSK